MSLRPDDDRSGRSGRSHSRTRERSRSRDGRGTSPNPKASSYSSTKDSRKARFAEDAKDEPKSRAVPSDKQVTPRYEIREPSTVVPGLSSLSSSRKAFVAGNEDSDEDSTTAAEEPPYIPSQPPVDARSNRGIEMPSFPSIPEPELTPRTNTATRPSRTSLPYPAYPGGMYPDDDGGRYTMMPAADYAVPETYKYAPPPDRITYTAKPQYAPADVQHTPQSYGQQPYGQPPHRQYSASSIPQNQPREPFPQPQPVRATSYSSYSPQVREVKHREEMSKDTSEQKGKSLRVSTNNPHLDVRAPSPGLAPRMDRLSVSGNRPNVSGHGVPPPSPLLEAYHGTYQSMPSPLMLPSDGLDDTPPLSPIASDENSSKKVEIAEPESQKKRVKIYDAEADADALASLMNHTIARPGPLIDILPELTHDQLLKLRDEYKKRVRVQNHGVNIAKHIKSKTSGNFGKICYVTALGRWESESYWANCEHIPITTVKLPN